MNGPLVIATIAGIIVLGGVLAWNLVPQRQRLKRLESRHEISLDQIYSEFFAERNLPKRLVFELWNEVAASLRLPPGKLRPSDRFDKELAPVEGWEFDDDMVEVHWAAERRLQKLGLNKADLSNVFNLGDYIEFFCNLAAQRQQQI